MFSAKGYCTHSSCLPIAGTLPVIVFCCEAHCQHMLCYKHWLTHQTGAFDDQSLDSDQESSPDLLKGCTSDEEYPSFIDDTTKSERMEEPKEIEWWNEVTPWKNIENPKFKSNNISSDEDPDCTFKTDNSKYSAKEKQKISPSITCRSYCAPCPLTFDGAFGLTMASHQLQLCPSSTSTSKDICLYKHFHVKHGFTRANAIRLVKALMHRADPSRVNLFVDAPSALFDPFHKVKCPLTTADHRHLSSTPCSTGAISRKSLRRHLFRVHQLTADTVDELIKEMLK